MAWLDRLQTLVRGEVWEGEEQNEVKVNESVLHQLVTQGFPAEAARVALRKTKNDEFAALLILTCPPENDDANENGKGPADAEDDSDQAKMQRLLDFFRDLGEQYWGWQMESAKRGRGFKGALKEHFLPLLPHLRQLAAQPSLPFGRSRAVQYQATCFMNRGLDECPAANEDRDRDRHRMSLETAPFVVQMVKSIGDLHIEDYKDSLNCEIVKETLKLLDNLVGQAVTSRLNEAQRLECAAILVKFVASFHEFLAASDNNAGLPGASGKLSAMELKPAVRSVVMFVSSPDASSVEVLQQTAQNLEQMGPLLSRNDPKLVESVLSVLTSFLQSFGRLSSADCDEVLGTMMRGNGPIAPLVLELLESATGKVHNLVVSLLCSMCRLSGRVVRQLLAGEVDDEAMVPASSLTATDTNRHLLLVCVDRALEQDENHLRSAGLLRVMETLFGCITEGHKVTGKDRPSGARAGCSLLLSESDHHKRISDMIFEDDVEEIELREMLEAEEIREDELFRSRAMLGSPDRRRAELEIRMQRLRRAKIARLQEVKSRRRYGAEGSRPAGAEGSTSGRAGGAVARELATGTRVRRGPDWKWQSQDGGQGNQGVVVSGTDKNSDGWVRVQWDKGGVNGYRWGAENAYDVEPVHVSLFSTAVRNKDLAALREAAAKDDSDVNAMHGALTPLVEAINYAEETPDERDVKIVVALVDELGADPNLASSGRLPLHLASERARPDIVKALLDLKADPLTKDADGLTAVDFVSRSIERTPPDGPRELFANYGKVLRMLEEKMGLSSPIVRRFKFEKEGGMRCFSKGHAGFRYPMPSQLKGNSSFSVSLRIKHMDPTGVRAGRACLVSLGRSAGTERTKSAASKGFSVFLHTRGHMQIGPGLCATASTSSTSVNLAICRGRWATVTLVYDSGAGQVRVYADGKLKAEGELDKVDLDADGDILVGTPPDGVARDDKANFCGGLADIQMHDKALSQDEVTSLHDECRPATDAHPGLQGPFCDAASRMLIAALNRPMIGANGRHVSSTKRQMLAALSRVLPLCSKELLMAELKAPLVRCLESLVAENLSSSTGRSDLKIDDNLPSQVISLLMCVDAAMNAAKAAFDVPLRRSGIVAKLVSLAEMPDAPLAPELDASGQGPYHSVHQPQDLSLYLVETHFGGTEGAAAIAEEGRRVSAALQEISASLASHDKADALYRENQARQALEQLSALFKKPEGVYCEELLASDLPTTLVDFLRFGRDGSERGTDDPAFALLENVIGGSGDETPMHQLITCLRLAVDKMQPNALPLMLHEDGSTSNLRALKQWVAIRFEKSKSDKSALDEIPSGHEVRAEPLSLIKSVRSTLEGMLQSPGAGVGARSREDKQGELRAMMAAFGDDPDGAPPSLLEHMRHLVDAEPRAHDVAPPIQRQFEALPSVHSWDREVAVTGMAKQSLSIALTAKEHGKASGGVSAGGSRTASAHSAAFGAGALENDQSAPSRAGAAAAAAVVSRLEMLRRTSARCGSAGATRSAAQGAGSKPPVALDLYLCLGKSTAHGGLAGARAREIAAMEEYDSQNQDEMQEDQGPPAGGGRWIMCEAGVPGAYAAMPSMARLSAGASHRSAAEDGGGGGVEPVSVEDCENGVLLDDKETLFEAMARLYAAQSNRAGGSTHTSSQPSAYCHPGRFWEQTYVVRYKRADAADTEMETEKDVSVEIPKSVMRHVLGRAGGGLRKMERESGAKIVQASIGRNESPVLRVSGMEDQVDKAVKLIHANCREAPTWREARDAATLNLHRGSEQGQPESGTGDGVSALSVSHAARSGAAAEDSGDAAPKADGGAGQDLELGQELGFIQSPPMRSCLILLDRLSRRSSGGLARARSLSSSETLNQHMRKQLEDALVVGSGLVSKLPWILELCKLHSVVSLTVRERCFLAGAFGPSRALTTLQTSSDPGQSDESEDGLLYARAALHAHAILGDRPRMYVCQRGPERVSRVPELVHETVEIDHRRDGAEDKPPLMTWTEQILEAHAKRETVLDVTWKGEAGHGSGPTRKFFEKVAALLASAEENAECRVWRDTDDGSKAGLFPAALPEDNVARSLVLKRLRLIGLFMGKALQQQQMPGLCLAKPLCKLLIGEQVGYEDVKDMDHELGSGVESVLEWRRMRDAILADGGLDDAERQKRLLALDEKLCMLENAADEQVTHKNLDVYSQELVQTCLAKMCIDEQIKALREGIDRVFPWKMLCVFSPAELQQKLWSDLDWDEKKLEKIVRPGPTWPLDKEQIAWLRQELIAMDTRQRRAFVKFVTASVCMPAEGNPIVVHPQVTTRQDGEDGDSKLPTSRTCTNVLYLPAYSSASLLKRRLGQAIWEEHIEFD